MADLNISFAPYAPGTTDSQPVGWADVRKPNSLGRSLMLGFLASAQPTTEPEF
jgi:hypothetical protein